MPDASVSETTQLLRAWAGGDERALEPLVGRVYQELRRLARHMLRNPVMFVVLVGSVLTTIALGRDLAGGRGDLGFTLQITLWLWFTVVFAHFAEAMIVSL